MAKCVPDIEVYNRRSKSLEKQEHRMFPNGNSYRIFFETLAIKYQSLNKGKQQPGKSKPLAK
jgi:hypothetical protein